MRIVYGMACLVLLAALSLFPVMGITSSTGAQPGFSGGPAENGATCQVCHSSFEVNEGTGSVSVAGPEQFLPGQQYTFIVSIDNTTEPHGDDQVQGFQVSVQDGGGNHIGQLVVTDETHTRFSGVSTTYITQTGTGRLQDSWEMAWTAPVGDDIPDAVTVYVAGNAAAGNGSPSGDYIYTTTLSVQRGTKSSEPGAQPLHAQLKSLYPNPASTRALAEIALATDQWVTLTLYDGLGRAVRSWDHGRLGAGDHRLSVDVAGFAAGLYFLEIATPDGAHSRPLTITP